MYTYILNILIIYFSFKLKNNLKILHRHNCLKLHFINLLNVCYGMYHMSHMSLNLTHV